MDGMSDHDQAYVEKLHRDYEARIARAHEREQAAVVRERALREALEQARYDVAWVYQEGFDSARKRKAGQAIEKIDAALAVSSPEGSDG